MSIDRVKDVPIQNLIPYIINGEEFREKVNSYNETSLKSANRILHSMLIDDEKTTLHGLINSQTGWYRSQHGRNTIKLKAGAMLVGLARERVSNDQNDYFTLIDILNKLNSQEEKLLKSVYLKQKIVTFKNLENNARILKVNKQGTINLYRGIKQINNLKGEYEASNLESWTSKEKIARYFAGQSGYILKREFKLSDIFAYKKSIFKYTIYKDPKVSKFINMENEYLVEFNDDNCIIRFELGNNLFNYNDSYLNDNW